MKTQFGFLFALMATTACAHNPPVQPAKIENRRMINAPIDKVWTKAMQLVAVDGYPIQTAAKESGVIATGKKTLKLDETQADCGNIWGLAYVKDDRTSTNVALSVILAAHGPQTEVTINTQIDGVFNASASTETKNLSCMSQGKIERAFLERL